MTHRSLISHLKINCTPYQTNFRRSTRRQEHKCRIVSRGSSVPFPPRSCRMPNSRGHMAAQIAWYKQYTCTARAPINAEIYPLPSGAVVTTSNTASITAVVSNAEVQHKTTMIIQVCAIIDKPTRHQHIRDACSSAAVPQRTCTRIPHGENFRSG